VKRGDGLQKHYSEGFYISSEDGKSDTSPKNHFYQFVNKWVSARKVELNLSTAKTQDYYIRSISICQGVIRRVLNIKESQREGVRQFSLA